MTRLIAGLLLFGAAPGCGGGEAPGRDPRDPDDAGPLEDAGPDVEPVTCGPRAGGTHWILEGETLAITVSCETGLPLGGDAFAIAALPPGAAYDPATAALEWTPGLDQAAVYELTITAGELGESGPLRIGVIDRWDEPANVPVLDPTLYTEEHGLPVFHIQTDPAINHDAYTPATITYRGHTYDAEAKYRGGASAGYPKLSFTLKFPDEDRLHDPDRGFTNRRKIVLTTTFDDNSYLRQRLAFEMWNQLDRGHIQVQSFSAVVFVDGRYNGLYAATDHVDRHLMEAHGLSIDGNVYKAVNHDANFRLTSSQERGEPKVTLHDGLEKKEGLPAEGDPGAFDDLEELVRFTATSTPEDFLAQIGTRLDQRDYEDWWIFVSFIQAADSAGKNSYHFHDPAGAGPWRYVPWDFNASFGQTWQSERESFDAPPVDYTWANEIFVRFLAEPAIAGPLQARYGEVLEGPYALEALTGLLDTMAIQVHDSALRDEGRWAAEMQGYQGWSWRTDFTTHEQEVAYVRQWIIDRWTFVDAIY